MRWIHFVVVAAITASCSSPQQTVEQSQDKYSEPYRPHYHFSPDHNWTNDPNGLVYYKGEYHLFYQYNPFGNRWGHMSWGHAVSPDLLHWQHLPVAIEEYLDPSGDSTMIFSGSAVVDTNNTSGFFAKDSAGIVAIYTSHVHAKGEGLKQHQSIAYSKDKGRTFTRYDKNPVIDIGRKDFRDPKVFWHEPTKKWIMLTVIPDEFKVNIYGSPDLKRWEFLSAFGPLGDTARIWECPDLFEARSSQGTDKKWVLLISNSHPQGPAYVGMQYFVGSFDGSKFTPELPAQYPLYLDYGRDYYAAITYNNVPESDGRVLLLGWANNWAYGQDIPTFRWRSAMAFPREVSLSVIDGNSRLIQKPIKEYQSLRGEEIQDFATNLNRSFEVEFSVEPGEGTNAGVTLLKTDSSETIIGYDQASSEVYVDRRTSGKTDFNTSFTGVDRAPVRMVNGQIQLTIFVDQSLIEVFVNGGEQVITTQVFPTGQGSAIKSFANDAAPFAIRVWTLRSTW